MQVADLFGRTGLAFLSTLALTAGSVGWCATPKSELPARSPFQPANDPAAAVDHRPSQNSSVGEFEFRGVYSLGSSYHFLLWEKSTGKSEWVRLNDAQSRYLITGFDPQTGCITVTQDGRSFEVALKQAKEWTPLAVATAPARPLPGQSDGSHDRPPESFPEGTFEEPGRRVNNPKVIQARLLEQRRRILQRQAAPSPAKYESPSPAPEAPAAVFPPGTFEEPKRRPLPPSRLPPSPPPPILAGPRATE